MCELGIIFIVIALLNIVKSYGHFIEWRDIKNVVLLILVSFILLLVPFLMESKISVVETYMSDKIYRSKDNIEFSKPVMIYKITKDRPFTWLGDTEYFKIIVPESGSGKSGI